MESMVRFLGGTLFGVGSIVLCVLAGVLWYLKRLDSTLRKLEQS